MTIDEMHKENQHILKFIKNDSDRTKMLSKIKNMFNKKKDYHQDLQAKLGLLGYVIVKKSELSIPSLYNDRFIYQLEIVDDFGIITARPKISQNVPENVVDISKFIDLK